MSYKLLIIKNNVKVNIEDDLEKVREFFKAKLPFDVDISFLETDITVSYKLFPSASGEYCGTTGTKDALKEYVPRNTYDAVLFMYGNKTLKHEDGTITAWTFWEGLYPETVYMEIPTNRSVDRVGWIWKSILHEMMHALCKSEKYKGVIVHDAMDSMMVNGVMTPYYKNDDPYAKDGNFAKTLENLSLVWNKKKYKYFKDSEVVGLKPRLVEMLDMAREKAGIPFVINSGYRTEDHNESVGGVKDSSHTKGEAVDLRALNSTEHFKITKALMDVGFTRISRSYPKHIHVDISEDKPQNVLF
jgi:zinc D-Ala-D-Ala carboxypeptidase